MSRISSFPCLLVALLTFSGPLAAQMENLQDELVDRLGKVESHREAKLLVEALAELGSDAAWRAIGEHLQRRGPAAEEALDALWLSGSPAGHPYILDLAAQASVRDPLSFEAVRIAALIPGDRAVRLLESLAGDWSENVKEVARRAQALRARAGLPTVTAIKEVPLNVTVLLPDPPPRPEDGEKTSAEDGQGAGEDDENSRPRIPPRVRSGRASDKEATGR